MDERDLSFLDVQNAEPSTLTAEQIAFYNEHGYIKPFTAYDAAGAERTRAYFDQLIGALQEERPDLDSYAINGWHTACRGIYDIVVNPTILDYVEDIVGPDVIAWGTHYFCKLPHDPKRVPWHQDASYWPLDPARTVTVWLAIDDADRENSAMMFLPKSHRGGHLDWRMAHDDVVLYQEIVDTERFGDPVHVELQAGQFSIHADMLAHASESNNSDRRRCGLTIRYCPPSVKPLEERWARNSILCRGSAEGSPWKFPPPPEGDNIHARIRAIGGN